MNIFDKYYQDNYWANDESRSGAGSTVEATATIREGLKDLMRMLKVKTLLDIPCGDFNWQQHMDFPEGFERYIGADVVRDLVMDNREKFRHPNLEFQQLDIVKDQLPRVDMVLVRDLFGHLSNDQVQMALKNLRKSGSRWLVATTFPGRETLPADIHTGDWRPINMGRMWGLGVHQIIMKENCTVPGFEDKSLGVWELNSGR